MDIYILDSLYRRIEIIDQFESLIYTIRYRAFGDFELHLNSTRANRARFLPGVRLTIADTARVMTVETVEDFTDTDNRKILKITGRSLEAILEDRVARSDLSDTTTLPKWVITGTPVAIAEQIFHDICVTGVLDPGDIIPGVLESDDIFPTDTIPEPLDTVTYEIDIMSVYKAIKDLADVYDIGFRLVRNGDTSQLYWDVYTGSDRTTDQTDLPAVVFSPELDNLRNTTELTTTALYKNVAYVFSPVGHEIVYASDVDPDIDGFDRRVMFVKADDITDVIPATATAKMVQRGYEELSKARKLSAFDGELAQHSRYVYGVHYNLGDLVEIRNTDGVTNIMRITEQIFVSDKEGIRSFPTLSLSRFITPGSWGATEPDDFWEDRGPVDYWVDQP